MRHSYPGLKVRTPCLLFSKESFLSLEHPSDVMEIWQSPISSTVKWFIAYGNYKQILTSCPRKVPVEKISSRNRQRQRSRSVGKSATCSLRSSLSQGRSWDVALRYSQNKAATKPWLPGLAQSQRMIALLGSKTRTWLPGTLFGAPFGESPTVIPPGIVRAGAFPVQTFTSTTRFSIARDSTGYPVSAQSRRIPAGGFPGARLATGKRLPRRS